jgi:hypothetical protein
MVEQCKLRELRMMREKFQKEWSDFLDLECKPLNESHRK